MIKGNFQHEWTVIDYQGKNHEHNNIHLKTYHLNQHIVVKFKM